MARGRVVTIGQSRENYVCSLGDKHEHSPWQQIKTPSAISQAHYQSSQIQDHTLAIRFRYK